MHRVGVGGNQKNDRSGVFSTLLAWQMLALNDEKKKSGLTRNIWYFTGEEASISRSWLCNKRRQEEGTCGGLGGCGVFLRRDQAKRLFFF